MDEKKIYIAGKVTGLPWPEVVAKFQKAEDYLRTQGWEGIVNPTKLCAEDMQWQVAMRICIIELMQCSHAYMLTCWTASKGAVIEHDLCDHLGTHLIYQINGNGDFEKMHHHLQPYTHPIAY